MSLFYRAQHVKDTVSWEGDIPITSRYTVGLAGERFFRAIKDEGKLLANRCTDCDVIYVPPRLYCERCFAHLEEWHEVPGTGWLYTYTIVHVGLDGEPLPDPRAIAFIRLDGTDGGLVHYVGEVDGDDLHIGMRVEVVFKDEAERKGSITDIAYFRPI
jgi:uncharacterized OB-fold protein